MLTRQQIKKKIHDINGNVTKLKMYWKRKTQDEKNRATEMKEK